MEDKFPPIDKGLIDALDNLFKDQSPDLDWVDRTVWYKAGQVSVVKFLKTKFNEQNETVIEDK